MRGKRRFDVCGDEYIGITPAGAGKTPYDILQETAAEDHPRRCGENDADSIRAIGKIGSPPQVRGKRQFPCPFRDRYRITPAGAGKTVQPDRTAMLF